MVGNWECWVCIKLIGARNVLGHVPRVVVVVVVVVVETGVKDASYSLHPSLFFMYRWLRRVKVEHNIRVRIVFRGALCGKRTCSFSWCMILSLAIYEFLCGIASSTVRDLLRVEFEAHAPRVIYS